MTGPALASTPAQRLLLLDVLRGVTHSFAHIPDPGWVALPYSISFTAIRFVPVCVLYRKKIFVKVQ